MSGESVIRMRGVGKAYDLPTAETNVLTRFILSKAHAMMTHETLWALRDIDLDVERGTMIGLLGPNGAGKSTLLKLVAGITPPTEGVVEVRGRVAAMLEVGLGFHDDLTGYENIYLHGAVLGLPREEIDRQLGRIVAFAELGELMSMPVKHFSSGMRARLGFAIAIHSNPDIVLADEVLAVGDGNFQVKCLDAMGNFKRLGKTLVFVTHNIRFARANCDRILWIDHGRIVAWGPSDEVATRYLEEASQRALGESGERSPHIGAIELRSATLTGAGDGGRVTLRFGDELRAVIEGEALRPLPEPDLCTTLVRSDHEVIGIESAQESGEAPSQLEGPFVWTIRWPKIFLNTGDYTLQVQIRSQGQPALPEPLMLRFRVDAPHFRNPHAIADLPCRFSIRPSE